MVKEEKIKAAEKEKILREKEQRERAEEIRKEEEREKLAEEEKQLALKQKAEEEERIRVENQRIKEWEEKFDLEQKKKEEELIKKFYSEDYSSQNKTEPSLETNSDNNKEN